jgi:hypothetical protein
MSRITTTATRRIGRAGRTIEGFARQLATQGETPVLQRAVVTEVIMDTNLLTDEYLDEIASLVTNPELVDVMPVGSIIGRIVSNQGGLGPTAHAIFFPMFSSHLMLPVQPGEQVYVMYEDYANTASKVGYWLTRVHSEQTIEDPNYTHYDRRFDPTSNPSNFGTSETAERSSDPPLVGFQNGGNTPETLTIQPSGSIGVNPYQTIMDTSIAARYITPEPVPRWKKRPQEFVLQGANNAIIVIGEDRNGPISGALQENPIDITRSSDKAPRQAGAIDLVVGRGRYFPEPGENPRGGNRSANPAQDKSTSPLVTVNDRNYRETDKNPFRSRREGIANPLEGDPDPIHDAARIYIVQQSRVDENYRLVTTSTNDSSLEYPNNAIPNEQPEANGALGRSYVVAKADHLRLVARKNEDANIAGTILIVREGKKDEANRGGTPSSAFESSDAETSNGDLAYIYLDKNGDIQIEGHRLILGRGEDEKEPYLRYTYYKEHINELKKQIVKLADEVKRITDSYNMAFTSATAIPYSTIAQLVAVATSERPQIAINIERIKQDVNRINVEAIASKKIFGQ